MSEGEEEGAEDEYEGHEGEGTPTVASLVNERSESRAQALVPAPMQPGEEELRDEPKNSLRQSEAIPMASSSSSALGVSESSIFGSMQGSKATFGSYLKYVGSHQKSYCFGTLLFGYLSLVMLCCEIDSRGQK
ncbi:unnamed protein product [Tuber aestivum]|uniref:Uncharacterized protein n=1 Tax=Tuber aestivum TaxID=59557 RepID=A0A292Q4Z2_9PEZI|nr:unnamed protein product [Tuber aestivum]